MIRRVSVAGVAHLYWHVTFFGHLPDAQELCILIIKDVVNHMLSDNIGSILVGCVFWKYSFYFICSVEV